MNAQKKLAFLSGILTAIAVLYLLGALPSIGKKTAHDLNAAQASATGKQGTR